MKKLFIAVCVMWVLFFAFSSARADLLGSAGNYNAFIYGDMNVWTTESLGRVAAGGNISMYNYGVGSAASPAEYSIVGGGDILFQQGVVYNGGIFAEGDVTLSHPTVFGNVTANGAINHTPTDGTITGIKQAYAGAASPVDFDVEFDYLKWVSGSLSTMTANGTTNITPWNAITLTGSSDINVFSLDVTDINSAVSLTFNIGADDVAIVNISGTGADFSGFGISGYEGKQGNILYNFYGADLLNIQNIGVKGSVLAPYANVGFNSAHIDGTLIANSLTGTGEFHQYEFDYNVPVVPEPVSSILFLTGGAVFGLRNFRKRITLN
ncbi:MAG: choice-of-anchor A family protein [Nitrospirota bacterium]